MVIFTGAGAYLVNNVENIVGMKEAIRNSDRRRVFKIM